MRRVPLSPVVVLALLVGAVLMLWRPGVARGHQSPCHSQHACPSDHHTYVWSAPGGPLLDCAEPGAPEVTANDTIQIVSGGLPYVCHPAAATPRRVGRDGTTRPAGGETPADARRVPNPRLTPGDVLTTDAALVCEAGWARSHRHVSDTVKREVFARYHLARVPGAYEVDHLISLELGGANDIRNLWPEPYAGAEGARVKDRLENRLHGLVCSGHLALAKAQRMIATDWPAAYRRYVRPRS